MRQSTLRRSRECSKIEKDHDASLKLIICGPACEVFAEEGEETNGQHKKTFFGKLPVMMQRGKLSHQEETLLASIL